MVVFWCEARCAGLNFLAYQVTLGLKNGDGITPCHVLWHLRAFLQAEES